jgi:hypothetical protein
MQTHNLLVCLPYVLVSIISSLLAFLPLPLVFLYFAADNSRGSACSQNLYFREARREVSLWEDCKKCHILTHALQLRMRKRLLFYYSLFSSFCNSNRNIFVMFILLFQSFFDFTNIKEYHFEEDMADTSVRAHFDGRRPLIHAFFAFWNAILRISFCSPHFFAVTYIQILQHT